MPLSITYILLAEILHIMDIESHHVSESAGEEQGIGSAFGRLCRISLHQAQLLHTARYLRSGCDVGITEGRTQLQFVHCCLKTAQMDIVDLRLAISELLAHGHRR